MKSQPIIRLAFADDHIILRKGVVSLLSAYESFEVIIEADNGKELIKQMSGAETLPDVCIIDINMPVMNGLETLIALKKKWPDIGVLVLTASTLDIAIVNMVGHGAGGYLLKSCNPNEIRDAITTIYNKDVYFSGVVSRNYFNAMQKKDIKLPHLTDHELQVLKYCCSNLSYADIAKEIGTSIRSVDGLRDSLFKKLNINNRVALALFAIQTGVVPVDAPIFNGRKFLRK